MEEVFYDSAFFIARLNPRDQLHEISLRLEAAHIGTRVVTSSGVLTEVLNYFSTRGEHFRRAADELWQELEDDLDVFVAPASNDMQRRARELYAARRDKGFSLTDCESMLICEDRGITRVMTYDEHFEQAGFIALMRSLDA